MTFKFIKNESQESELKRLYKQGYINIDGKPIICYNCDCIDFNYKEYYMEYILMEYEVICRNCNKIVGHWAYGYWEP
jgi:hypothetical protein